VKIRVFGGPAIGGFRGLWRLEVLSVADDCKLQGVLVEEKRDREELRGGIPVEEKRGKEELRLQICYFLRRILGFVLHIGERFSCTKKMGFAGSRVMEVVIKQSGGLVWKNWPMNHTRRANAKKRHVRLRQVLFSFFWLGCCISSLTYFEMQCKLHS
jgi:hypothetical protein